MEAGPVDLHPRQPELAQGAQERRVGGPTVASRRQAGEHRRHVRPLRVLAHQRGQRLARTDLQEYSREYAGRPGEQRLQAVGEAHLSAGYLLHRPQGILQGEGSSQAGCHVLPDAAAEHRLWPDTPRHPQPGQRVFDGKQGRLGQSRLLEPLRVSVFRVERLAQVEPQQRAQDLRTAVHLLAEDRLARIQLGTHAGMLCTLAGEEEEDRPLAGLAHPGQHALRVERREHLGRVRGVRADHDPAMVELGPPHLQGVGDVGEVVVRMAPQVLGQVPGALLQRRGSEGREDHELERARRAPGLDLRRLFEHQVGVGAADPERAHPRTARPIR
jgi:hypothetical protein